MSTFTPAETLRQNRPLLLAVEAIGWFHMAGKARMEFLRKHGEDNVRYDERKWHDLETPPFDWDTLLEWTKRLYQAYIPDEAWPGSFKEFTERHHKNHPGLLGLLQAAHGIVSGVEKNLPGNTSHYLNQTVLHMWLSSPWGHPKRNLLANPPEILAPQGWQQLVTEIRRILEEARQLGTSRPPADVPAWKRWREQAIGEGSFIRQAFLSTLAETRLPNNDVTLWDQSYVTAALFKSAVAGALLRRNHPWGNNQIKNKVRWRLLTVAISTEHYEARSVKIGDWTGIQKALESFFDQVATLIEVDLAAGSLLYYDSSVIVFSFPGELFNEASPAPWINGWDDWLQEQIDSIAQDLNLETPPYVRLSEPTRSLVPIAQERKEAIDTVAVPIHRAWDIRWQVPRESRGHVCPVCHVRLNGDPTSKAKPCSVCRQRRHHRRDDWIRGHLDYNTIWFEEVADRNGRLAMLTFSLDIEPWLNGERVDSLRVQSIPEWFKYNRRVARSIENQTRRWSTLPLHERLIQYLKKRIDHPTRRISTDGILRKLIPNLEEEFSDSVKALESWKHIFVRLVEDRAVVARWDERNTLQNANWLVFQSFRKLPSPGRIYRFWREAEEFFQDLLQEFRQIASRSSNPWRIRRMLVIPEDNSGWRDLTLYNGRWQGVPFSLLYVQNLGGFVTTSNLARLLKPEENGKSLENKSISLVEENQFEKRELKIKAVYKLNQYSHLGIYTPVIPIEISPMRFRVIVPLEAASECVDLAISWWKKRFSRVWDRLPLRVGVVAFPRLVPYQAVVEAIQNIENTLLKQEEGFWTIENLERHGGMVVLHLRQDHKTLLRAIPVTMPDGRDDVFYPYFEVEDQKLRFPRDFRHPDGRIYRHASDLRIGDSIKVSLSSITTLFMDSSAARFQIANLRPLDDWQYMREVWNLLRRVAPSQTALQRLRNELYRMEDSWKNLDQSWDASEQLRQETYRALLAHHLDNPPKPALEVLTQAAMSGLLRWALDWHLTALKESIK